MINLDRYIKKPFLKMQFCLFLILTLFFSLISPEHSSSAQSTFSPVDMQHRQQDFLDEAEEICNNCLRLRLKDDNPDTSSIDKTKAIRSGSDIKKIALTFDDGPFYTLTEEYIKVLLDYDVPATFFLLGLQIDKYPDKALEIAEAGFEIGIHSYGHKQLTKLSQEDIDADLERALSTLKKSTGKGTELFRPPYGDYNNTVLETTQKHDLATILWNVDPRDWAKADAEKIANHVINHTQNGSIILLHEGRKGTLKALPIIITTLREQGYEFVSVSELLSEQ